MTTVRSLLFVVWLYLSNSALLLGVQVNAEVQRGRLLQAGDTDPSTPLAPRFSPDDDGHQKSEQLHGGVTQRRETP